MLRISFKMNHRVLRSQRKEPPGCWERLGEEAGMREAMMGEARMGKAEMGEAEKVEARIEEAGMG